MTTSDPQPTHKGHYLGTEIDETWWKRFTKDKLFARGNGVYWFDPTNFCFRRYLTKQPIQIPYQAITGLKIGKSHAGRWFAGGPILKIVWKKNGATLSSGFIVAKDLARTESVKLTLENKIGQQEKTSS